MVTGGQMISSSVALDECCHISPCLCKAGFGGWWDGEAGEEALEGGGRGRRRGRLVAWDRSLCLAALVRAARGPSNCGAVLGPRSPAERVRGGQ